MRGIVTSLSIGIMLCGVTATAETVLDTDQLAHMAGTEAYRFPLPLPAGFRLSGGVAVNGNRVTVNALANGSGTLTINRVTWSEGGSLPDNRIGFKDLAPYGGLGYTKNFGNGFKLNWDAGALFGSAPMLPRTLMLGLPDNLVLQNDYLESRTRTTAIAPMTEISLSFRF